MTSWRMRADLPWRLARTTLVVAAVVGLAEVLPIARPRGLPMDGFAPWTASERRATARVSAAQTAPAFFAVGPGFVDVTPRQLVRTREDRLFMFAGQAQHSPLVRAYWTTAPGLPTSTADFAGAAELIDTASVVSVDTAYDGERWIHVLVNTTAGELKAYPFDTREHRFLAPRLLASDLPRLAGDYIGTAGLSALVDPAGHLHVTHWTADRRIVHRLYEYAAATDTLVALEGPTRVDADGGASHPIVAVSPADGGLTVAWIAEATPPARILARTRSTTGAWGEIETVSTAPVWTSTHAGINIDQGPSLAIGPDGRTHLAYMESWDSTGDYGRVHHATRDRGAWSDQAVAGLYTHDPALALGPNGEVAILGHGHPHTPSCRAPRDMCLARRRGDGTWTAAEPFASPSGSDCFDASPSVKWSAVGLNRSETVEFLFFAARGCNYQHTTIYYGRY